MKMMFVPFLLTAVLMLGATAIAQSQTATPQSETATQNDNYNATATNNHHGSADNVRTLSGCLQEGAGANEYTLFGPDANSWELRSNQVDLAAHVGQAVTITYVPNPNAKGASGASAPLIVTDLVMVSSSCSW